MSKSNKRYLRSIVLLVLAMGGMVWSAVDLFDIPIEEMRSLLIATAVGVGGVIVAAAVILLLLIGLRKLFGGSRDQDPGSS